MKSKFLPVAMLTLGLFGASGAFAGSANIPVSASVTGTCQINTGNTIPFGTLDQTSTAAATLPATNISFWCTKGTTVGAITLGNGANYSGSSRRMLGAANGDFIPYTITAGTPTGTAGLGKTTALYLPISGSIANADFVNVSADAYADTVSVTIAP